VAGGNLGHGVSLNDSQIHGREEQQANEFVASCARRNCWTGPNEVPRFVRRIR